MFHKVLHFLILMVPILLVFEPSFTVVNNRFIIFNISSFSPECLWPNRADSGLDIDTGAIGVPAGYSERHQFVHPDWIHFQNPWGPKKDEIIIGMNSSGDTDTLRACLETPRWSYWMVCNALPGGNDDYENPYIRASNDKQNWIRPYAVGIDSTPALHVDTVWVRDPIFDSTFFNNYPSCSLAYFSDVELAGYEGRENLWSVFRLINLGSDKLRQGLIAIPSSNGITWRIDDTTYLVTDSGLGLSENTVEMMSPTINLNENSVWEMWFVNKATSAIGQRDSTNVIKLTCPRLDTLWWSSYQSNYAGSYETCYINPPSDSTAVWHLHVTRHPQKNRQRYMLATITTGDYSSATFGQYLYISDSDGVRWEPIREVIPCSYPDTMAWDYCTYRGSFFFEESNWGWCLPTLYTGFNFRSNGDSIIYRIGYTVIYLNCCGDVNNDGAIDLFDITFLIADLYLSGPSPEPTPSADVNNNGTVNIFDITFLISYLYLDGPPPICN